MLLAKHTRKRMKEFFLFMAERQRIWEKRQAGKTPPWTKDPILRDNYFTNIYRELDKGTIYWFRNVLPVCKKYALKNHPDSKLHYAMSVVLATVVYRLVNRQSTFEWIEDKLGYASPPNKKSIQEWYKCFKKAPDPKFTGAHVVAFGPGMSKVEGLELSLMQLEKGLKSLTKRVLASKGVKGVWNALKTIRGIGGFVAYEIVCDLFYAKVLKYGFNSWCNPGPGCKQGLNYIFNGDRLDKGGIATDKDYLKLCKWIQKRQRDIMHECGIDAEEFPYWNGKGVKGVHLAGPLDYDFMPQLSLRSIEHSLCEFQKYVRVKHEGGRAKNRYKPNKVKTW